MFGWFRSKCPIAEEDRRWIEHRMVWLVERLGTRRIRNARTVLPTEEFFPDPYDGSAGAVRALLDRVCGYMDVDPARVELQFYSEQRRVAPGVLVHDPEGGSAGLYEAQDGKTTIWLETSRLEDPLSIVATCAHELGHFHLLGKGLVDQAAEDHEPLTDLLTVFFGLGVFSANTVVQSMNVHFGAWEQWHVGRQGYLTASLFGYALAWYAWYRKEKDPAWSSHLRPDAREPFRKGLRHLEKRGEPGKIATGQYPGYPPGAFRPPQVQPEPAAEEDEPDEEALQAGRTHHGGCVARGILLADEGDYEGAIRQYSESLLADPNDAEVYQLRGLAYWHLGDHARAIADGQQAIRLEPEELDGYRVRGLGHFGRGEYPQALADFNHVLDEEPEDAEMYYWCGRALAAQGQFDRALRQYNQAIRYAPIRPEYYLARAEVQEKLGRRDKAQADREEAGRRRTDF